MKKIILTLITLFFLFGIFSITSSKVKATEKTDIVDHANTSILDCYGVINATNRPYPTNYDFHVGLIDDEYQFVKSDGTARKAISGAFFTSYIPLTTNYLGKVTTWEASAEVTGMAKGDWGGFGIMFAESNGNPITIIINETGAFNIAANNTEYAKSIAKNANIDFNVTGTYTFYISVENKIATFKINNIEIGSFDMSGYQNIKPSIGPVFKNYTASFKNFKLEVLSSSLIETTSSIKYYDGETELTELSTTYTEGYEKDLAIADTKTGYKFDGWYDNQEFNGAKVTKILATDTGDKAFYAKYTSTESTDIEIVNHDSTSLLQAYAIVNTNNRPYPSNWGLRFGIVNNGYEFVDGSGSPKAAMSGVYITTYLPLTKTTTNVTEWTASCTVTGMERGNWGGFGIMFGENNGSPITFTINEAGGYTLSYGDTEFKASYNKISDIDFSVTGTYNFKVTVKEGTASLLVNSIKIADADIKELTNLKAAIGPALSNYTAHFTNFKLIVNKNEVEKEPETFVIKYYDGENEIVSMRDSYVEGNEKTLNEPEYKEGYLFEGWFENSELSGEKVTKITTEMTGNKTFYAKYSSDSRTYIDIYDTNNSSLLDAYSVTNESYRPYPSNYGLKFGIVDGGYEFTNADGVARVPMNGTCMTTYLSLTKSTRYVTAWKASVTVTGIDRAAWGGFGLMFAKYNGAPVTFWLNETGGYTVSYGNEQSAKSYAANENITFNTTDTYTIEVVVLNQLATFKVNGIKIGELDMSSLNGIKAAIGPMLSNYTAHFTNFKLLVDETEANREPDVFTIKYYNGDTELIDLESTYIDGVSKSLVLIPDTSELLFEGWYSSKELTGNKITNITEEDTGNKAFYAKFSAAPERKNIVDNSSTSTIFGYSALSLTSGTNSAQPYPKSFGIQYLKKDDGYHFVNSSGESRNAMNGTYVAFPLPLTQKVTGRIKDYVINASFTLNGRAAFGGAGMLVGWYNNLPVCVVLNENSVCFTINQVENAKVFSIPNEIVFDQAGTYEFKITVKNNSLSIIINNIYVGVVDISQYDGMKPAVGPAIKNYSAIYTNIELNILKDEHEIGTIEYYDGYIVINGIENAYDIGYENIIPGGVDKEGYTFVGWYDNPELTGDMVSTISSTTTGIVKLYAKYVIDESTLKNIAKDYNAEEFVTCVEVATDTITQFMNDIKFKKVDGKYVLVDANGNDRIGDGMHIAGIMASELDTKGVTSWIASIDVTGIETYAYGGYGIVFGWYKNKPACLALFENNICLSMGTTEIVTVYQYPAGLSFSKTGKYRITVKVTDMIAKFYINGIYIAQRDLNEKIGMMPCIGCSLKNYNATFENLELFVSSTLNLPVRTDEFAGVIVDPEVLDDFDDYDNLVIDSIGLISTYGVTEEFKDNQPFSTEFGINVGKINDYYTRVDNLLIPNNAVAFGASYIPTRYNVSKVFKYIVSANFKITERINWGGVGLVFGRNNIENSDSYGAPLVVWISEENENGKNVLSISYDYIEWTSNSFELDEKYIVEGNTLNLAVVVEGYKLHIYINNEFYTSIVLYSCKDFEPVCGIAFKNWTAEVRDLTFKTNSENLSEPVFTITKISSGVEIGTETYRLGENPALNSIERKGYRFAGWHLLPDLSDSVITEIPANIGGNINLYCEYVKMDYSIKYYDGDKEITSDDLTKNYKYKTYVELTSIEKKGYKFVGWYDNPEFDGEIVEAIMPSEYGNKVFYAKYEKESGCKSSIGISIVSLSFIPLIFVLFKKKEEK